jgi:HlyD family secretion protein
MRRVVPAVFILAAIGGVSWYTAGLKPAEPAVDKATIWIDTVRRGPMLLQVRGMGKLAPEEIRWIPATVNGIVERKLLEAGARVQPDTVLIELSDPQIEHDTLTAEWNLRTEEANMAELKVQLQSQRLTQIANLSQTESEQREAQLEYEAYSELSKSGIASATDIRRKEANLDRLARNIQTEKERQEINKESTEAQLAKQQVRVDQARALYALRKNQLEQLKVRAGVEGVLQELLVETGQRVGTGTNLARVVNPAKLKAEISISETQARDVQLGQEVSVDTRNGVIEGRVSRIDPAVRNGSVTVDIRLTGELPKGARPDLSVDGIIVLERLDDIVYVGRPVKGEPDSRVGLFLLSPDGKRAERVMVTLGRSSVNTVEIKEGLQPGDQVILSDMTEQDGIDSIRIN